MRKGSLLGVTAIVLIGLNSASAESYKYDVPVILKGTLVTATADPSATISEKKESFPALKLDKSITVVCDQSDPACENETDVNLMQLALNDGAFKNYKNNIGNKVNVKGSLFHSDNGHHLTRVLILTSSIETISTGGGYKTVGLVNDFNRNLSGKKYLQDTTSNLLAFIIILTLIAAYFIPFITAKIRKHHNALAIFVLNFLLGWTALGWIAALIWSCTQVKTPDSHKS